MRTIDTPTSAGLGLRRGLLPSLLAMDDGAVDFLEVAPENWIGVGGKFGEQLAQLSARFPISAHGLSLSLGGTEPLDLVLLKRTRFGFDLRATGLSCWTWTWPGAPGSSTTASMWCCTANT